MLDSSITVDLYNYTTFSQKSKPLKGFGGNPSFKPGYWETVFRTNTQSAYMAGKLEKYVDTGAVAYQLLVIEDERTSKICRHLLVESGYGAILPVGHRFWQKYGFPPYHFNCRTSVCPIYSSQVAKTGYIVEDIPMNRFAKFKPQDGFGGNPLDKESWWKMTDSMKKQAVKFGLMNLFSKERKMTVKPKEKFVKTATNKNVFTVSDIKKNDDIVDFFINVYGAETNNRIAFMDIETTKEFMSGVEEIQKDFGVKIPLKNVSTTFGGITSYTYGGNLRFNTADFQAAESLQTKIAEEIKSGYFGKDTTPALLGKHETAHGIEEILIRKRYKTEKECIEAWDNCTIAEEIMKQAYENLNAMGETKSLKKLLGEISEYANDNWSDGLAECLIRKSSDKKTLIYQVRHITIKMLEE